MSESVWSEERLGQLLRLSKPVPGDWVAAAAELPRLRAALGGLVGRAEADAALHAELAAELETALAREGLEPTPRRLEFSRKVLRTLRDERR
jgi:hypothetical protein